MGTEEKVTEVVDEQQPTLEQLVRKDEEERSKNYTNENILTPERLEFETYNMYAARRRNLNKNLKRRLSGSMFFISKATVPMYEGEGEDKKLVKHETFTNTFRYKDHPELQRKIFKEKKNEEVHNQDGEEQAV
jgi:hypothetical protein